MTLLESFINQLKNFLTRSFESENAEKVIKFYENQGPFDFSFPISFTVWRRYIKDVDDDVITKYGDNILQYAFDSPNQEDLDKRLAQESSRWIFTIANVELKNGRCNFKLDRATSFQKIVTEVGDDKDYGKMKKTFEDSVALEIENCNEILSITQFRLELIKSVCERLLNYSPYELVAESLKAKFPLMLTVKSNESKDCLRTGKKVLLCGVVLDPSNKKTSSVNSDAYIKMRCDDMHLIAIHKYGVRAKDDKALQALVGKLGRNAATLDLLAMKTSSACSLTADPKQAFILYNSARMETLMETFEKRVSENIYGELPDINRVDWNLLKEDEEWHLVKLVLTFPSIIHRSISEITDGKINIHLLHRYLTDIANTFSVYYRRVKLLTEPRPHLLPTLHAKIHFLKCVQRILNETLHLFCIEPITFM